MPTSTYLPIYPYIIFYGIDWEKKSDIPTMVGWGLKKANRDYTRSLAAAYAFDGAAIRAYRIMYTRGFSWSK